MDIRLSNHCDGIDVAVQIRAQYPVEVAFLSAFSDAPIRIFEKPAAYYTVQKAIESVFNQKACH